MKIYINTDVEHYGLPRFLIKYIERAGLREMQNNGIVFNIDSIHSKGFVKGSVCTVYIEGDEYLQKGINKSFYDQSDIIYIVQKNYLPYYPTKTKVLKLGIDLEICYPRNVKKEYDYVFVGKMTGNPVYDHRREVIEKLQKSKYKILVTEGTQETYCDLMSSGRIILNVLPRVISNPDNPYLEDVCANHRILEGMAMGCVMTDYHPSLDDWGIIPNVH